MVPAAAGVQLSSPPLATPVGILLLQQPLAVTSQRHRMGGDAVHRGGRWLLQGVVLPAGGGARACEKGCVPSTGPPVDAASLLTTPGPAGGWDVPSHNSWHSGVSQCGTSQVASTGPGRLSGMLFSSYWSWYLACAMATKHQRKGKDRASRWRAGPGAHEHSCRVLLVAMLGKQRTAGDWSCFRATSARHCWP